jgi:hypothetical protein
MRPTPQQQGFDSNNYRISNASAEHFADFVDEAVTKPSSSEAATMLTRSRIDRFDMAQGRERGILQTDDVQHVVLDNLIHLGPTPNHSSDHPAKICVENVSFWYGPNLGDLVEVGDTQQIFVTPGTRRCQDFVTGRYG